MQLDGITSLPGAYDFWAIGADNLIRVDKLKDQSTGVYVTSASTFRATLKDANGAAVGSAIDFSNVAAYSGRWQGSLMHADSAGLVAGHQYTLEITITAGTSTAFLKITRPAKYASA